MHPDPESTVWARATDVVWRLGPDRVLVRRVGDEGLDLVGAAAMVWVALDEPLDGSVLVAELADVGADRELTLASLGELASGGLVVSAS